MDPTIQVTVVREARSHDHRLGRLADQITIADIIRAVEGPLTTVRGSTPERLVLQRVWIAVRKSLRDVLEQVTLADVVAGQLPEVVNELLADPDAWPGR